MPKGKASVLKEADAILFRDTLTMIVDRFSKQGVPDKFVVIGIGQQGVGVVLTPGMSASEALGSLYMAIDKLSWAVYGDR